MKDDQQDIRSESVRLQREVLEMKAIGDQLQDDVSHMQGTVSYIWTLVSLK